MRFVCGEEDDFAEFAQRLEPVLLSSTDAVWLEVHGCDVDRLVELNIFLAQQPPALRFKLSLVVPELFAREVSLVASLLHFCSSASGNGVVEYLELDSLLAATAQNDDPVRQEQNDFVLEVFCQLLTSSSGGFAHVREILPGRFGSRFQRTARFFQCVEECSTLRALRIDVRDNEMAMYELMEALPHTALHALRVAMPVHSMEQFMRCVASMSTISELDLSECQFGQLALGEFVTKTPDFMALLTLLDNAHAVRELNRILVEHSSRQQQQHQHWSSELAIAIAPSPPSYALTTQLLMPMTLQEVLNMLHHMQRLKAINFGGCRIGYDGLVAIFRPLTLHSCGLTSLDVSSSGMEDRALKELCATLQNNNCTLQRLSAYDNDFSMQSIEDYLLPVLRHENCKLTSLAMVSDFGTDDARLDGRRIDYCFARMIFARQLFAMTSSTCVRRLGTKSALRRLPQEMFRLLGGMFLDRAASSSRADNTSSSTVLGEDDLTDDDEVQQE